MGFCAAVADRLDRHQHDPRIGIVDQEAGDVEDVNIGLVAAARLVADAEAGAKGAPHHADLAESTAVRDHADTAGPSRRFHHRRGSAHRQAAFPVDDAVTVRAQQPDAYRACQFGQLRLPHPSGVAPLLGVAGGKYGDHADAEVGAAFYDVGDALRRHCDADVIGATRQGLEVRITGSAADLIVFRIDRPNRTIKAEVAEEPQHPAAIARDVRARADERHCRRLEQCVESRAAGLGRRHRRRSGRA